MFSHPLRIMRSPALLLTCFCLLAAPVWAQDGVKSLEQAVAKVKKELGARVLTASEVKSNGGRKYRIKILDEKGHVRNVYVDAKP